MNPNKLRKAMSLNPDHRLWNKDLNKWDDNDKKLFEKLCISKERPIKILKKPHEKKVFRRKVIRLSDGKIYNSIQQCRLENGFYNTEMYNLLKEETKYKKL